MIILQNTNSLFGNIFAVAYSCMDFEFFFTSPLPLQLTEIRSHLHADTETMGCGSSSQEVINSTKPQSEGAGKTANNAANGRVATPKGRGEANGSQANLKKCSPPVAEQPENVQESEAVAVKSKADVFAIESGNTQNSLGRGEELDAPAFVAVESEQSDDESVKLEVVNKENASVPSDRYERTHSEHGESKENESESKLENESPDTYKELEKVDGRESIDTSKESEKFDGHESVDTGKESENLDRSESVDTYKESEQVAAVQVLTIGQEDTKSEITIQSCHDGESLRETDKEEDCSYTTMEFSMDSEQKATVAASVALVSDVLAKAQENVHQIDDGSETITDSALDDESYIESLHEVETKKSNVDTATSIRTAGDISIHSKSQDVSACRNIENHCGF